MGRKVRIEAGGTKFVGETPHTFNFRAVEGEDTEVCVRKCPAKPLNACSGFGDERRARFKWPETYQEDVDWQGVNQNRRSIGCEVFEAAPALEMQVRGYSDLPRPKKKETPADLHKALKEAQKKNRGGLKGFFRRAMGDDDE